MRMRSIKFPNTLEEFEPILDKLQRGFTNFLLNSGGLAIKTTGSALAKSANSMYCMIDGEVISKSASDMAALSGTVTHAKFNVFVFLVDSTGTLSVSMGSESSTLAGVLFPQIPEGKVALGFVIINPTGTGNFVGGTTPIDDSTVIPNAVFVNTPYPFYPEFATL